MKIVLGVCTLNYQKRMVDSMITTIAGGNFAGWCIPDCCLLPAARNKVISEAYEMNPDFTHILFVDDDMCGFTWDHVLRLASGGYDIVSALVTLRHPPYTLVASFLNSSDPQSILGYIKAREAQEAIFCGMAFTLITREVLDALREEVEEVLGQHDYPVWFTTDRSPRLNFQDEVDEFLNKESYTSDDIRQAILMGQHSHRGTRLIGEDIDFCRRARQRGFKIFIDCGCPVGHIGENVYDFRYPLVVMTEEAKRERRNAAIHSEQVIVTE
jgi:hypothetical protein